MTLDEKSLEIKKLTLSLLKNTDKNEPEPQLVYAETLAALYHAVMNVRANEPQWEDRDRLITGKSALAACCAALAVEGFIPGEQLAEHFSLKVPNLPGLDSISSVPGENLKIAVDTALEARANIKIYRTFVLIDQEDCLSGALWENAIRAGENMLDDLTVILCRPAGNILSGADNICAKFSAFGFDTFSVSGKLAAAVAVALQLPQRSVKPRFICCDC